MNELSSLTVDNKAAGGIASGLIWVRADSVVGRKPRLPCIVRLIDKRGNFLGQAFCTPDSMIFLRIFSRADKPVTKELWREKIMTAYKRRAELLKTTNAVRVVHAESDGIPSVVIDKYNDIFSFQITSAGAELIRNDIIDIIKEEFAPSSIIDKGASNNITIASNVAPASNVIPAKAGIQNSSKILDSCSLPTICRDKLRRNDNSVVFGNKSETTIHEGELTFTVDVLNGQKTGAYLDYRKIRQTAAVLARGKCLDAFCYEGWFACTIAKNAASIVAVDSSERAVEAVKNNAAQNSINNITAVRSDVMDFVKNSKDKFDFIHLDPPSFVKSFQKLPAAISGYKKLIKEAVKILAPKGTLLISSCSHNISERILEETVLSTLKTSGFNGEVIMRAIQDSDHPLLKGFPESLYLKAIAVRSSLPL